MAESIDFQIRMKTTCKAEIKTFCRNVPHGHARVIRSASHPFTSAFNVETCISIYEKCIEQTVV